MPLDGQITDFVKPVETQPDLSTPSLEALAWVLERQAWPATHRWDFRQRLQDHPCGTAGCALGVADILWSGGKSIHAHPFEESCHHWGSIFVEGAGDPSITPAIVAARIRDHLAGRPIRYS